MVKKILILFILVNICLNATAQKKKKPLPKYMPSSEEVRSMIDNIPMKDDKILYDTVVYTDTSLTKQQLFIRIRQWFVENFTDSKNVLEVNDEGNGLLTGKGKYSYSRISGINKYQGTTTFVINVAVKDGKFRYRLYDFFSEGIATGIMGSAATGLAENINLDEIVNLYRKGKRESYAKAHLTDMIELVYFINYTLDELISSKQTISDF